MSGDGPMTRPRWVTPVVDAILALTFFVFSIAVDQGLFGLAEVSTLLAFLMALPLAFRRTHPVFSAVAVYAMGLYVLLQGYPAMGIYTGALLLSLYAVTTYGPRWASRTALGSALFGCLLLAWDVVVRGSTPDDVRIAFVIILITMPIVLVAWAAGRLRHARVESKLARNDRVRQLAIEREQELRLAAQTERARIAREMHDIVAHSLTVMVAQADGGRYAGANDPGAATFALETIAETGRAALADMRRLLGVLRDDDGESERDSNALAPQPGSGDLESLVEQVRASGLTVSLVRMGTPRALPPGVGLTAYRICQEALTNVMKHAGPDPTVTLLVQWTDTSLTLEISDDGRGAAADVEDDATSGHGLLGMRERAMMLGGTVSIGPRPGGGFRVRAQLPLPAPGGTP